MYELNKISHLKIISGGIYYDEFALALNCYTDLFFFISAAAMVPGFTAFFLASESLVAGCLAGAAGFAGGIAYFNNYPWWRCELEPGEYTFYLK